MSVEKKNNYGVSAKRQSGYTLQVLSASSGCGLFASISLAADRSLTQQIDTF
jgi:hypothetical protein